MNLSLPLFDLLPPGPSTAPAAEPQPRTVPAAERQPRTVPAAEGNGGGAAQHDATLSAGADVDAAAASTRRWLLTQPAARAPPAAAEPAHALHDPVALHPSLWRASQLGGVRRRVTASGFELLDAELPGGGWPHGELTELLLAQPGIGELRLLAPALAAVAQAGGGDTAPPGSRCVMLFDPPAVLSAWALQQQGLDSRHWLVVHSRAVPSAESARHGAPRGANRLAPLLPAADLLWALEQALRSAQLGAALAWLPLALRADALRRLQLAAQGHDGPVFMFRDAQARSRPSAAPLRLLLQPAGVGNLSLRLLKRRGPPLAEPLRLALPPVLTPRQHAQALAHQLLARQARAPLQEVAATACRPSAATPHR